MTYAYSGIERTNESWFAMDMTRQSLVKIELAEGQIRSLSPCDIEFKYPISAIAGRNCSGKTTLIALAACAFHNTGKMFAPTRRQCAYYTYSDFFIQTADEVSPAGIEVRYTIASDQWEHDPITPDGIGRAMQVRKKVRGGRWSDYHRRVERPVYYFGIDRIVPHAEKSVYKGYRHNFAAGTMAGWESQVSASVARVLETSYDTYQLRSHNNYRLPFVARDGFKYSGFNMGAGEKVLFEIFSAVHASSSGTLFVIDEIELGLHEHAQRNLIDELNQIAAKKHIQVICTTHSAAILDSLPPKGRFLIERSGASCTILPEVSSAFAMGRLSGIKEAELHVHVEDSFAASLLGAALPMSLRERIAIVPIGSVSTIVQQFCARYREPMLGDVIAIVDGDYDSELAALASKFAKQHDNVERAASWISGRLLALPTDGLPPESFVLACVRSSLNLNALAQQLHCSETALLSAIDAASHVDPHDAFYRLGQSLHVDPQSLVTVFCMHVGTSDRGRFSPVVDTIEEILQG